MSKTEVLIKIDSNKKLGPVIDGKFQSPMAHWTCSVGAKRLVPVYRREMNGEYKKGVFASLFNST